MKQFKRKLRNGFCVLLTFGFLATTQAQQAPKTTRFDLASPGKITSIYMDDKETKVVHIATDLLANDIQNVCGQMPKVETGLPKGNLPLIVAGTIGSSELIDKLVNEKKLDVSAIAGQWESWSMQVLDKPFAGTGKVLVIAGSDRRATAYGLLEISRQMGISAWEWWADVQPEKRKSISLNIEAKTYGSPSVKFRGLFLNDEDWGLQPWAAKTFEPETRDIGPKTYAKIFELMLRLRANTIWPAMHGCTKAFYTIDGNAQAADDYAIVVGTSHCEPMLCNVNAEWKHNTMGEWRYDKNEQNIRQMFEDRVKSTSKFDNIYTIGMRGEHDSPMNAKDLTEDEQMALIERVIADQRSILQTETGQDPKTVPQAFIPYKEVLDYYQKGLKVPEDVTLMWTDDNYGYIRQFSTPEEQKRPGGSGIYYHASYWGRPHDYLWLSSTAPALIWEEMYKAYQLNARDMWILNCGDIKPLEYHIELFMDMAWDMTRFPSTNEVGEHQQRWLGKLFGDNKAAELNHLMTCYYQLCWERRPEFMAWSQTEPTTKPGATELNQILYGDELTKRLNAWESLSSQVEKLKSGIPARLQDAFYQLVYYPVTGASLMNQKWLYHYKNELAARQGRSSATDFAARSEAALNRIKAETDYFNTKLQNGKWKHMMSMSPRNLPVFSKPAYALPPKTDKPEFGLALEGYEMEANKLIENNYADVLPLLNSYLKDSVYIDVFLKGEGELSWQAKAEEPWILLSADHGQLSMKEGEKEQRIWVKIDWYKVPQGVNSKEPPLGHDYQLIPPAYKVNSSIAFSTADTTINIGVTTYNPKFAELENYQGFIEANGYVSINAENFQSESGNDVSWTVWPGLGYSGAVVATSAYQAESITDPAAIKANSPVLEYDFYTFNFGEADVRVQIVPTHPLYEGKGVRCAVAIDDAEPVIIDFQTFGRSNEWKQNVLKNAAVKSAKQQISAPGKHHLKVWMVDPGVMIDQILIDLGGWKGSYAFPPETIRK
ncbi:glycosyl hydrolase 115 family protein [Gaoshiqia sediminis]|uniref:Glycosyl hydrolase 115 family protein n=1 Tax=Gaoshiqia sediminis TaxID=2986998 RepID=A0AA41Y9P7_9BACT|nr:glycosyl hydrolase 115 family protein [Gaoshiqia sediminis]MCW0482033.1 glycosyl hydrolase 115 family protein [Gaoshiqia sediminis]